MYVKVIRDSWALPEKTKLHLRRLAFLALLAASGLLPLSAIAPVSPVKVKPVVETSQQQRDRLSLATKWSKPTASGLSNFQQWVDRYLQAPDAASKQALLAEGKEWAAQRRVALLKLIRTNPREALTAAVPLAIRAELPDEVTELLETRVEGTGDFHVIAVDPVPGKRGPGTILRTVQLNGVTYQAYVYGRRAYQATKFQLPLSGIAIGNQLALLESPVRLFEAGETLPAGAKAVAIQAAVAQTSDQAVLTKVGAQVYSVATAADVAPLEAALIQNESSLGPTVGNSSSVPGQAAQASVMSSWTLGAQRVLVIIVDFSDLPGVPPSDGSGTTALTPTLAASTMNSGVNPYYVLSSYNQTSLTTTVATRLYRMPQTASHYAVNNDNAGLHTDAENLAAADFNLANFDRIIVDFAYLGDLAGSQINYGGLGDVGGPDIWINGFFDNGILEHELGHTYGLNHANLWHVTDGNPVSATGTSIEYNDPFDVMGSGTAICHFNPWDKYQLLWMTNANVTTVTTSGTYRVKRFDSADGTGALALTFPFDATRNYWVGLRKSTGESVMSNSAYIIWGYNSPQQSNLLDTQTPGSSAADAGLPVGRTFTDATNHLTITTVAQGGAAGAEYLDLTINFSSYGISLSEFPTNGGVQTGAGGFAAGSVRTVTATANSGFVFSNWTENGTIVSTSPVYSFTLNSPRNLVANYYPTTPTSWLITGSSTSVHSQAAATLLQDGRVLVSGGSPPEIYDPTAHTWKATGTLDLFIFGNTSSLLASGKVLAAGGSSNNGTPDNLAELYDPTADTWSTANNLVTSRIYHTATVLTNGQVLLAGGDSTSNFTPIANAELYDPTTGNWTATGSLPVARSSHTATLMANGQVLVVGGTDASNLVLRTAALYDPVAKTWSGTGSTSFFRYGHTATLLTNGKVLVVGGSFSMTNAELYDPVAKTWSATGSLTVGRANPTATLLANGLVLVAGGEDSNNTPLKSAELYNPATGLWTAAPGMNSTRSFQTATLLNNKQVLAAGGQDTTNNELSSAELFLDLSPQTLTSFPATLTLTVGQSPYTLPATTSAGLTVTYTVISGPATVSGNTLTFTSGGSIVVMATQGGSSSFAGLSQTETISTGTTEDFATWEGGFSFAGAADATPKGDAVPNLLKYIYDINPTTTMTATDRAALPIVETDKTTTPGTTYLALKFRRFQSVALPINLQASADLQTWATVTPDVNQTVGTDSGDPIVEMGVIPSPTKKFIRLNVVGP